MIYTSIRCTSWCIDTEEFTVQEGMVGLKMLREIYGQKDVFFFNLQLILFV